jgi:two-component system, LytTR family, sensor kinase
MDLEKLLEEARLLYEQDKNEEAAALARSIVDLAEAEGNHTARAYAINTIGNTFFNRNLYEEALEQYLIAEKILSEYSEEKNIIPSLINIAIIYNRQKFYDKAIAFYQKALKLSESEPLNQGHAQIHNGLGNVYSENGDNEKSYFHFEEVLKISEKLKLAYGKALALSNMACVAIKEKNTTLAHELALKTLQISESNQYRMLNAVAKSVIADACLIEGKIEEGIKLYDDLLPEIKDLKRDDMLQDAYRNIAEAYCSINDYKKAYEARIEYENATASINSVERTQVLNAMQTRFETEKKEKAIRELQLSNEKIARRKVEAELTSLRTRMNPHFVYNVMNTVRSLIHLDKKNEAMEAVEKFARLNRLTLEHSGRPDVSIDQEIELLENYIETEQLLMNEGFSYTIEIDDEIETDFTFIPSLLVQPFVENAIKHGLMHSDTDKKLHIKFEAIDDATSIVITDNGIGIKNSSIINENQGGKPKSFATKAIEERINLLNESRNKAIFIKTYDLQETENKPGTKVEIIIPND